MKATEICMVFHSNSQFWQAPSSLIRGRVADGEYLNGSFHQSSLIEAFWECFIMCKFFVFVAINLLFIFCKKKRSFSKTNCRNHVSQQWVLYRFPLHFFSVFVFVLVFSWVCGFSSLGRWCAILSNACKKGQSLIISIYLYELKLQIQTIEHTTLQLWWGIAFWTVTLKCLKGYWHKNFQLSFFFFASNERPSPQESRKCAAKHVCTQKR